AETLLIFLVSRNVVRSLFLPSSWELKIRESGGGGGAHPVPFVSTLVLPPMSLVRKKPFDRELIRAFDQMFEDEQRNIFAPCWRGLPSEIALSLGCSGGVENTREKFAVHVDVSHFEPEEVKVILSGNELTIEGHHEEKSDEYGSMKRSFVRKFHLPEDAHLDSLRSSFSDKGVLSVEAPKKTLEETESRVISIKRV
ncbi:hypothetical protein PMAYCL1PPCAC_16517, partial [Pristionchus mayeri]